MQKPANPTRVPRPKERGILSCWKDIANYFGKGVRTVQRWEKSMGMPVHRPRNDRSVVFADPQELKQWAFKAQNNAGNTEENDSSYPKAG